MAGRIEDYAIIGDCETAALIGRDGSVDWLCWPRFDSDACFTALLGGPEHGRWRIAPRDDRATTRRRYRPDSLVLETEFELPDGSRALVTDCMPMRDGISQIVRQVTGLAGRVAFRSDITLRFGYGANMPWVTQLPDGGGIRAVVGPDMAVLRTPVPLQGEDFCTVGDFDVAAGECVPFVLSYAPSHGPLPGRTDAAAAIEQTDDTWRGWASRCHPVGRWSEAVRRSAITLKALTYAPTGGIVAAATTSLPEAIGGPRNWDYRICWLRDATLTLLALLNAGYREEAVAWRDWLLRAIMGSPSQVQVMYGVAGERNLHETEVEWLPGYEGSRPVRVGNAAYRQNQHDVFGQVLDALHQGRRRGIPFSKDAWALQCALLEHVERVWQEPDYGIWEVRSGPEHFVHSKVMCWAAVDRAVRDVEAFGLKGPLPHWRALRQRIHEDVCRNGYDQELGSFVRSYGSRAVDASLLLLPAIGFLPPEDPRIRGTVAAVERRLPCDGMVRRYDVNEAPDGLPGGEGAFIPCSFWLVEALAMDGRRDEAERMFEHLLTLRNDVGLLAEEYDTDAKRQLGNFPQAFSHVALMNAAYLLEGSAPLPTGAPAGPDPEAGRPD
ncbi:MAG TPA: glycoside hydrolase family 15 protein [Falsiroseomonas sp.]|jgi:GH15 family glucan-1,4-alpha-glucosidase|nr:glycoside hydrolase family 15 protein [Falsiroseomonas sp.]